MGLCFSDSPSSSYSTQSRRCRNPQCQNIASPSVSNEGYCFRCYNNYAYMKTARPNNNTTNNNRAPNTRYYESTTVPPTRNTRGYTISAPPEGLDNAPPTAPPPSQPPPTYEAAMNPPSESPYASESPIPTSNSNSKEPVECPTCSSKLILPVTIQIARCPFCEHAFEVQRDSYGQIFTVISVDERDIMQRRAYDRYYDDNDYEYCNQQYATRGYNRSSAGTGSMLAAGGAGILGGLLFAGAIDSMF